MSDISLIIKKFNALSTTARAKPIVDALQEVADKTAGDALIAKIRIKLLPLLTEESQSSTKQNLADVAYDTLLILAEFYPLNIIEPITQLEMEDIERDDLIFISTGHQFALSLLIEWHNQRAYRTEETRSSKSLLNPITNLKFSPKDLTHIRTEADKKGITINDFPTNNPPAMNEAHYSFIFSLWESELFWGLFLGVVVFPFLFTVAFSATFALVMPAVISGAFDLSLSWLLFTETSNALFAFYLVATPIGGLFSLGVSLIASELVVHGIDRATNLVTSPFRWSASFFSNHRVPRTEEEQLIEDFLLSPL